MERIGNAAFAQRPARHMSFTRAADELHVTQTAISHQIRRVEEQLGKRLFVRSSRTLRLTRDAEDYLPAVRAAFEDLRRATARLQRPDREGLLTVSTTASLASKWLVTRVASFQDAHPGIEVRMTTSTHLVDFQREEVDMAVRYSRGNWSGLRTQWLMAEDIFPVCSPPLLTGPKPLRRPEDLVHHTLLHTRAGREDWQLWLTAAGLPVSPALRRGLSFRSKLYGAAGGSVWAWGRPHQQEPGWCGHCRRTARKAVRPGSPGRCRLLRRCAGADGGLYEDRALPRLACALGGGGLGRHQRYTLPAVPDRAARTLSLALSGRRTRVVMCRACRASGRHRNSGCKVAR